MDNPVPMTALRSNPAFRRELASYSAASASKPNPASLIFLAETTLFNSGRENPMSKSSEGLHPASKSSLHDKCSLSKSERTNPISKISEKSHPEEKSSRIENPSLLIAKSSLSS
jgi:hypothetical protein